jgi:hypothetical protein
MKSKYLVVLITDSNYVNKTISCINDLSNCSSSTFTDFEVIGIDLTEEEQSRILGCTSNKIKISKDSFPEWSKTRSHSRDYASSCRALHINRILRQENSYEFLMYSDVDQSFASSFNLEELGKYFEDYDIMLRSASIVERSKLPDTQQWRTKFNIFNCNNPELIESDLWQESSRDFNGNAGLIFLKFNERTIDLSERWHKLIEEENWVFPCDQTTLINLLRKDIPSGKIKWRAIPRIFYKDFHHEQFSRFLMHNVVAKRNESNIKEILDFLSKENISYE